MHTESAEPIFLRYPLKNILNTWTDKTNMIQMTECRAILSWSKGEANAALRD
jgi:hypothetical protein